VSGTEKLSNRSERKEAHTLQAKRDVCGPTMDLLEKGTLWLTVGGKESRGKLRKYGKTKIENKNPIIAWEEIGKKERRE